MIPLTKSTRTNYISTDEMSDGKFNRKFEKMFSDYIGVSNSITVNSGTAALHLALKSLNVGIGDEVVLPSYTCISLLHAIHYVHATPIFSDVNYNTEKMDYNINIEDTKKKVTTKTKAIIVPHLFGSPSVIDEFIELGIPIIEDFTQSVGSIYKEHKTGSYGDIAIASLHSSKMLSTGEGGILCSNSEELLDTIRYLAYYDSEQSCDRLENNEYYSYKERYNYKMSGMSALLGISQLTHIDSFIRRRKQLADIYNSGLVGISTIEIPDINYIPNVFFRYIINLKNNNPTDVLKYLLKYGIEAGRGVFPSLDSYYSIPFLEYPNTKKAISYNISLPIYPSLKSEDLLYIITKFKEAIS